MNMIERMTWRWMQPANEGKRVVIGLLLNLTGTACCLWLLWQCVEVILS
jgi:hypothetical protein